MNSLGDSFSAVVIGANGGIGSAIVALLDEDSAVHRVFAASRKPVPSTSPKVVTLPIDVTNEASIESAAARCADAGDLALIVVATGLLHRGPTLQPERSWVALDPAAMVHSFAVNALGPALIAKHFLPLLPKEHRGIFAALSARVGSIGDNRLGGWYSYRASKAALNMLVKTLAIELARKNPSALCLALHPGTVETELSVPFRPRSPANRLFSRERAASQLLRVIDRAEIAQSGQLLAWDGQKITP